MPCIDWPFLYVVEICWMVRKISYETLNFLPKKQQNILLLDFWQNPTVREIAERQETTTCTVHSLRNCSYQKL